MSKITGPWNKIGLSITAAEQAKEAFGLWSKFKMLQIVDRI